MSRIANTDPEQWHGFRPDESSKDFDEDDGIIDLEQHARDQDEARGAYDDDNAEAPIVELFDTLTPYQRGVVDVIVDWEAEHGRLPRRPKP